MEALDALKQGTGDCEGMTSLFIALCRAGDIPSRTVWVQGHCYPEFYLEDDKGEGHWFPCQAARSSVKFGGIVEDRPVLQKGDNFKPLNGKGERQRYLAEFLTGAETGGKPHVAIRELLGRRKTDGPFSLFLFTAIHGRCPPQAVLGPAFHAGLTGQ